ncbi:hypothetical protein ACFWN2_07300 [Lentzea sp. NPDC058436]|uniref:hypothetical protein n=1 Tax=Lentzea sp. NPDC058436 TaxID=3346499 RepID=UPI003652D2E4
MSNSLSTWLAIQDYSSNGVSHELLSEESRPVTDDEAHELELPAGATAQYRRTVLRAQLSGDNALIATANSLVAKGRLPRSAIGELQRGVPLGLALQPMGVLRQTATPTLVETPDGAGGSVLTMHLRAVLLVGGCPWAITDEVVHQCMVEHRVPGYFAAPRNSSNA